MKPLPSLDRLNELFRYEPETGKLIRRKGVKRSAAGTVVGSLMASGHVYVSVDYQKCYVHRVVWKMVHGEDPEVEIDHINGVKDDNRLSNLRLADRSQNAMNSRLQKNSTSGLKGVTFVKDRGNWLAQIKARGVYHYLGHHNTKQAAHEAYKRAAERLHGEFARFE